MAGIYFKNRIRFTVIKDCKKRLFDNPDDCEFIKISCPDGMTWCPMGLLKLHPDYKELISIYYNPNTKCLRPNISIHRIISGTGGQSWPYSVVYYTHWEYRFY